MVSALKKLKALQALHEFDIGLPSLDRSKQERPHPVAASNSIPSIDAVPVATWAATRPAKMPRHIPSATQKCRLPLPAFVIDKDRALAVPAPERVANVLRKRQSMTEESRNQGSRLPVLILSTPTITPVPEELTTSTRKGVHTTKLRTTPEPLQRIKAPPASPKRLPTQPSRAKSSDVRISLSPTPAVDDAEKVKRSTEKVCSRADNRTLIGSGRHETPKSQKPPLSPRIDTVSPSLMVDLSSHTKLRIPQSRTARLTLGISTNGRCYSKDIPIATEDKRSPGRRAVPTMSEKPGSDKGKKSRPASFAGSVNGKESDNAIKHLVPISPRWQTHPKSRRQSAPVPAKNETDLGKASALKGVKALRVH